jgi:hypothetical protein
MEEKSPDSATRAALDAFVYTVVALAHEGAGHGRGVQTLGQ